MNANLHFFYESNLPRINQIWEDREYQDCYKKIETCETDRIFCRHNMAHFLDVARLAYIENLEKSLGISRELIYAAGLLHDIGRHIQYLEGTPHEKASVPIARSILNRCHFTDAETADILKAIADHRDEARLPDDTLSGIIYRADKLSRACFSCTARESCHKSDEKKRLKI